MGRANVYLPDDLERRVKAAQIPISEVCQRALLAAVEVAETGRSEFDDSVATQFRRGWDAGVGWTRSTSPASLLRLMRDQRLDDIPAEALPDDLYTLTEEQSLAWEAGFVEAARVTTRLVVPTDAPTVSEDAGHVDAESSDAATATDADTPSASAGPVLGDDAGCHLGVTLDGDRVSFDPHAAVRAGKSPLFAILGAADLRARLSLSVAQDAASRGTAVVLIDLSGQLTARASGLGKNVRVVRQTQPAMPQLDDLVKGAVGLGGLWNTLSSLSATSGLAGMFSSSPEDLVEPGYVTVLGLAGDGPLGSALSFAHAAQALTRLASPAEFPRLVQVDLPAGISVPPVLAGRLGRIIRAAREQNAALGLSADSADTVTRVGGGGALLSTVFAFATSDPVEADRLRDLLGAHAPILLNPPGTTTVQSDETWAVMRDLNGRLGQVRIEGW